MGVVVPIGEQVATFVFNYDGVAKDVTWSIGCSYPMPISPSDLAALVYDAFVAPGVLGSWPYEATNMRAGWTFQGVSVMEMTGSGPLVGQFLDAQVGSDGDNALPINCAVLGNKQTALGGRKNRGRAYLPPVFPAESTVNGAGQIDSSDLTTLQAQYDAAFSRLEDNDVTPLLHHSDGSAGTPITGFVIGSLIATQRRRLR